MNVKWIWHRCARQEQRIALLISGLLPDREQEALAAHLKQCPACRRCQAELEAIGQNLTQASQTLPEVEPGPELSGRWMAAVWAQSASLGSAADRERSRTIPAWDWFLSARQRLGGAGLAAVWSLILLFHLTTPAVEHAPPRRVTAAPGTLLQVLRAQDEWLAQGQVAWERPGHPQPVTPALPAPRSQRKTNLYLA